MGVDMETSIGQRITNESEQSMKTTAVVKDPVCGMDIDAATAAGHSEYKGQTHYFCATACKEKFASAPEQYVGTSAGRPKSGGCCS